MERYHDRKEAGKVLAQELTEYANRKDVIILALPRGGVPIGYEIAKMLHAPLDVFIVRKLGVPGHEELAMGAIAFGGVTVFNHEIVNNLGISQADIDEVIEGELKELKRREQLYRGSHPFPDLSKKVVILVDDGIATGATIRAAIKALKHLKAASIIAAVPVAEMSTCEEIAKLVDRMVCPLRPSYFYAVGAWYDHFNQTSDDEVRSLLSKGQ